MQAHLNKLFLAIFIFFFPSFILAQDLTSSKDIVNKLYNSHTISFELKNNEKKGWVFVEYLKDEKYQYEISLVDRIPVNKIDSEDILRITVTDLNANKNVLQNTFDKGINDIQDFDKEMMEEFSKVMLTEEARNLTPLYSYIKLKTKVFRLQEQKITESSSKMD